jgi:hypothetical protein
MQTPFLLKNQPLPLGALTCFRQEKAPTTYQADGAFTEQNAKRTAPLFSPKLDVNGSVFEFFETQELVSSEKIGRAL